MPLLVLVLFLFSPPLHPQAQQRAPSEALIKAEKALDAKDYATALRLLKEEEARDPQNYRVSFDIGYAHTMLGDRGQAIEAYRTALTLRPELTQARMNLAILLLEEKQASEAADHLARVVAARPKDARARALLANALAGSGNRARAIEEYRAAIALDPKAAEACQALGRLLLAERQFPEAEQQFTRALELQPGDVNTRLELAALWEQTGRPEQARRLYMELSAQHPENATLRRRRGELLMADKQFKEAAAEYEAAARLEPSPDDDWNLARAYAGARQTDAALQHLGKLAAPSRENYEVRLLMGEMLTARRDFAAAQQQLRAAIALKPDLPDAYVDLANVLYLQQDFAGALGVLDRLRAMGQDTPWLHFLRAITLDKLEQPEPALESYERFLAVAGGRYPDQEFQARQRVRALNLRLEKAGKRRKR